ncbi:peptide chain release factor 2 [Rhodococcus sp. 06-156-3C]|uniref:CGNR zinc finger domain-containing protein n=1 Tax=Nocardiaceae TaxID=85025 RepID=UPI00052303BA|nr:MULTISPECIES: CGNR zinc finger domain-containing protein [Rhodococcus]OZD14934.1 peptide chain release factor 2 [Rhodococcus sp. 06-156-4C]OZD19985.1 peptide chain release factor 2 [Rhodococcus sp. 06-156-4a]OZD22708.1 peptide chain release factor 2 [Rhodococcus sp. 06-156-3C]OZD26002.1 peptide chain release factor 2 [Rhodococcus sp. 06-156-3b]OZD38211.1 peptide chain release factor 2 [Rhodococcus sp. 06-156-3]
MSSTPTPTERFRLDPAPDGLAHVQNLLNTRAIDAKGLPDLLADGAVASAAMGHDLSDADAAALRELRTTIELLIAGTPPETAPADAVLTLDASGTVQLRPSGTGHEYVTSRIWAEILLAQRADTWRRLKRCRNEPCGSAFYDRSRNNSGVWHDVKTCGNIANLRASRARRRA